MFGVLFMKKMLWFYIAGLDCAMLAFVIICCRERAVTNVERTCSPILLFVQPLKMKAMEYL